MPQINKRDIATFSDGTKYFYAIGRKDNWKVFIQDSNTNEDDAYGPKDEQYFQDIKTLADNHSTDQVYSDFCHIYNITSQNFCPNIIDEIKEMSSKYGDDSLLAQKTFSILYATMVAEYYYISRNGQPSRMKKRMKHLGVYQVLVLNQTPLDAANFSWSVPGDKLERLCNEYGILL